MGTESEAVPKTKLVPVVIATTITVSGLPLDFGLAAITLVAGGAAGRLSVFGPWRRTSRAAPLAAFGAVPVGLFG